MTHICSRNVGRIDIRWYGFFDTWYVCVLRNYDTDIVAVPSLNVSSFLDKQMPSFLRTTILIYSFIICFPFIVITLFSKKGQIEIQFWVGHRKVNIRVFVFAEHVNWFVISILFNYRSKCLKEIIHHLRSSLDWTHIDYN